MIKKDFTHHNKRRAFYHDYRSPSIYHITLNKSSEAPYFGELAGDCRIKNGTPGCAYIKLNRLGNIIARCIHSLSLYHTIVEIYQYIIMPDHIHVLLRIREYSSKPLGYFISNLSGAATREWRAITNAQYSVFEKGYNDRIIGASRSLDTLFRYIKDNPRRLAVRHAYPDYFRHVRDLTLGGMKCQTYGNLLLLENPFKEQVVVHRADTAAERATNRERWLHTAANGGVLVSPFISPDEKNIRTEAEVLNGKIILITNETMGERFKPAAHDFTLCEQGYLLIISVELPGGISRQTCLAMNALAKHLTNYASQ